MERNTPRLGRPKPLAQLRNIPTYPILPEYNSKTPSNFIKHCQMDSCFDYSMCPISARFHFYVYTMPTFANQTKTIFPENMQPTANSITNLHEVLRNNQYLTRDYLKACIFLLIIDECEPTKLAQITKRLPHWFGDGRNHVIWMSCSNSGSYKEVLESDFIKSFGRAIIATETIFKDSFRYKFDLVVSHWKKTLPSGEIWTYLPSIVPAKRKYLATYLGMESSV